MSDHTLPDDIKDWPQSPWEILGIEFGADRKQIRRAWAQLIRVYRPDESPEKFQKIEDAYQSLSSSSRASRQPQPVRVEVNEDDASEAEKERRLKQRHANKDTSSNRLDFLWRQFRDSPDVQQYRELRELSMTAPGMTHFLMLHWMLTLRPDFDPRVPPLHWIITGINCIDEKSALTDVLIQTVHAEPHLADLSLLEPVIGSIATTSANMALLKQCVTRAATTRQLETITECVKLAEQTLTINDGRIFREFLTHTLSLIISSQNAEERILIRRLLGVIQQNDSIDDFADRIMDDLEAIDQIATTSHDDLANRVLDQLRTLPGAGPNEPLLDLVSEWEADLAKSLESLTELSRSAPEVVWFVHQHVQECEQRHLWLAPDRNLTQALKAMLTSREIDEYAKFRIEMAVYCSEFCVSSQELVCACREIEEELGKRLDLFQDLLKDKSLLCLIDGVRLLKDAAAPDELGLSL